MNKILFLFDSYYMYNLFKININNGFEVSKEIVDVLDKLQEIGIYGDLALLEERDEYGNIQRTPYLICVYEG